MGSVRKVAFDPSPSGCDWPYCNCWDDERCPEPDGHDVTDDSIHEALCVEEGCSRCTR